MGTALARLLRFLEIILGQRDVLAHEWVGRHVRLAETLDLPLPDSEHLTLGMGTEGKIVALSWSCDAPFVVEFAGVPYRVAPLLEQIVIQAE